MESGFYEDLVKTVYNTLYVCIDKIDWLDYHFLF